MEFIRKKSNDPLIFHQGDLPYLSFKGLGDLPGISHAFTTRLGGVSSGYFSSMNFRYHEDESDANVRENFRRLGALLNAEPDHITIGAQSHGTGIRIVTLEDAGKGVTRPRDYTDVDGLVTDIPGLVIGILVADCVPVFFADPVKGVVAVAHSGWRGTAGAIGAKMIGLMVEKWGSVPSDIHAAIGPSICGDCYEIGEDVAAEFADRSFSGALKEKGDGKYLLDLWKANRQVLLAAGLDEKNIETTDICTMCNPSLLFSHRYTQGRRGNLGAFIKLEEA